MTDPQTEQTRTPEPESGNLFRVLETHAPDSATAHAAVEEVKNMAGHNVVVQLGARIDKLEEKLNGRIDKLDEKLSGRIDNLSTRMDGMQRQLNWIWALLLLVLGAIGGAWTLLR